MSASHIECLPSFCQNCHIWWKFDVVITILLVFLRHGVRVHAKGIKGEIEGRLDEGPN